jgi:hypothetical protein
MSDHARVWKQNLRNPIISYHVISLYIYIRILRIFTIISGQNLPATSGQVACFQSNEVVQVSTKGLRMSLFDTWTNGPMDKHGVYFGNLGAPRKLSKGVTNAD